MIGEINNDYYCSANRYAVNEDCKIAPVCGCLKCKNYHRKYPTPEQFKAEYGFVYPDDGAVYFRVLDKKGIVCKEYPDNGNWRIIKKHMINDPRILIPCSELNSGDHLQIVCACTPWGMPPRDWRPE